MHDPVSRFVSDAIREMVELQVRESAPPEARRNVARLVGQGFLREEALALIGCVLSREMFNALDSGQPFDARRYTAALAMLPALPWDDDRPLPPTEGNPSGYAREA
ncbi:MAG: hypothetical protein Q7S69_02590 [Nitrosomonadaceae bacterium]|nr:hypothetical protein [Nitrosomonadaceae bacterium]